MIGSFESKEEVLDAIVLTNKALSSIVSVHDYVAEHELSTEYSDRLYDLFVELEDICSDLKEEARCFRD